MSMYDKVEKIYKFLQENVTGGGSTETLLTEIEENTAIVADCVDTESTPNVLRVSGDLTVDFPDEQDVHVTNSSIVTTNSVLTDAWNSSTHTLNVRLLRIMNSGISLGNGAADSGTIRVGVADGDLINYTGTLANSVTDTRFLYGQKNKTSLYMVCGGFNGAVTGDSSLWSVFPIDGNNFSNFITDVMPPLYLDDVKVFAGNNDVEPLSGAWDGEATVIDSSGNIQTIGFAFNATTPVTLGTDLRDVLDIRVLTAGSDHSNNNIIRVYNNSNNSNILFAEAGFGIGHKTFLTVPNNGYLCLRRLHVRHTEQNNPGVHLQVRLFLMRTSTGINVLSSVLMDFRMLYNTEADIDLSYLPPIAGLNSIDRLYVIPAAHSISGIMLDTYASVFLFADAHYN